MNKNFKAVNNEMLAEEKKHAAEQAWLDAQAEAYDRAEANMTPAQHRRSGNAHSND